MFLRELSNNGIIKLIIAKGGEHFLETISAEKVVHRKSDPTECLVSHKKFDSSESSWAITDTASKPVFKDRFYKECYADYVIFFISQSLAEFRDYARSNSDRSRLSEDDLRDPMFLGDIESIRKFKKRLAEHLEQLEKITPQFASDERIEDHQ